MMLKWEDQSPPECRIGDIYMQQEKDAWLTGEDPVGLSDWGRWAQGRLEKEANSRRFCKGAVRWQPTGRPPEWEYGPRHCWMLQWGPVIRTVDEVREAEQPPIAECAKLSPDTTPELQLEAKTHVFEDSALVSTATGDSASEIPSAEGRNGICRWNFKAALPEARVRLGRTADDVFAHSAAAVPPI